MADLLTHVAAAYLPARPLRDARFRAVLYVGVALPDVLYKAGLYLLGASTWCCEISHAPLPLAAICYAGALLFEEAWRRRAFAALLAGGLLHLLVDAGKDYLGQGVILWAFPFSMDRLELGLYYPEETALLMLPAAAVIAVVELVARNRSRPAG